MFELASNLNKLLKSKTLDKKQLQDIFQKFTALDSKTGLYFSSATIEACHNLRQSLLPLLKKDDSELQVLYETNELEIIRRDRVQALELALKYELGVFGFDSPMSLKKTQLYKKYSQLWPLSKKASILLEDIGSKLKKQKR